MYVDVCGGILARWIWVAQRSWMWLVVLEVVVAVVLLLVLTVVVVGASILSYTAHRFIRPLDGCAVAVVLSTG